jgi:hypothetical protein
MFQGLLKLFLTISEIQVRSVRDLKIWLEQVAHIFLPSFRRDHFQQFSPRDVFIGFHEDAPASVLIRLSKESDNAKIVEEAKAIFLECATPDAISRLSETMLDPDEKIRLSEIYYSLQKSCLAEAIQYYSDNNSLIQVTTFSRLLTTEGKDDICLRLKKDFDDIQMITLQQINTEEQFSNKVHFFLESCLNSGIQKILIVQGLVNPDTNQSLIECARYAILNQVQLFADKIPSASFCIVLVLQVPRICGGFFSGFPGTRWKALHIDELCGDPNSMNVAG